jgi:hypothetical protein
LYQPISDHIEHLECIIEFVPPELHQQLWSSDDDATHTGLPTWLLGAPLDSWTDRTRLIENVEKGKDITTYEIYKLILDAFHTVSQTAGTATIIQQFAGRCLDITMRTKLSSSMIWKINLSLQTEGEYIVLLILSSILVFVC